MTLLLKKVIKPAWDAFAHLPAPCCRAGAGKVCQKDGSVKPNGCGLTAVNECPLPVSNAPTIPDGAIVLCLASISSRLRQSGWRQGPRWHNWDDGSGITWLAASPWGAKQPSSISAQGAGEMLSEGSRAGIFPWLCLNLAGSQGSQLRQGLTSCNAACGPPQPMCCTMGATRRLPAPTWFSAPATLTKINQA